MITVRPMVFLFTAGVALTTAACEFDPAAETTDLSSQLHRRATLTVSTQSEVEVQALTPGGRPLEVDLSVLGGIAVLRTTHDVWLLVEDLELPLDDIAVPAGALTQYPMTFTDLTLRLGTQLAVRPVGLPDENPTALFGHGRADLLLDWSMRTAQGEVFPLAIRRLQAAPFSVAVTMDGDGQLHASLSARVDGVIDDWGDLLVFHDLAIDVVSESLD